MIQQGTKPPQTHRSAPIAQHLRAKFRVGCVNADVERRQSLGHNTLKIGLGESREGSEIPVKERESVIIVLEVQAAPHPRRKLVDEAKLAVVIAGAHLIKHRGIDLYTQRSARRLQHVEGQLQPIPEQIKRDFGLIGQHPVLNDVANRSTIHSDDLISGEDPKQVCRRSRCHCDNSCN
ncbi:unannotated protein [freshwater metagenome]|uniref:Unannotated protein n=1 Tax=freshwater metagenome TaxID=449393 RepID=A0A6J6PL73_9ZZZZ